MINKDELSVFVELYDEIDHLAMVLLKELNDIKKIDDYSDLAFDRCDNNTIFYSGHDHYYGGDCEDYNYELSTKLLYDPEFKKQYIQELLEEIEAEKQKLREKNELKQKEYEKNRYDLFLKLKKEFGE